MSDRKLLLERLERLAIVLDEIMPQCAELVRDALAMLKEQEKVIERLEHDLAVTQNNLNYYVCGND